MLLWFAQPFLRMVRGLFSIWVVIATSHHRFRALPLRYISLLYFLIPKTKGLLCVVILEVIFECCSVLESFNLFLTKIDVLLFDPCYTHCSRTLRGIQLYFLFVNNTPSFIFSCLAHGTKYFVIQEINVLPTHSSHMNVWLNYIYITLVSKKMWFYRHMNVLLEIHLYVNIDLYQHVIQMSTNITNSMSKRVLSTHVCMCEYIIKLLPPHIYVAKDKTSMWMKMFLLK